MTASVARKPEGGELPAFAAPYAPPDEAIAAGFLAQAAREAAAEARIDARATRLVAAIRAETGGLGGIEDFLREYSLSTREGLALMVLAEALLRVPDSATADRLIEDKLSSGDWTRHEVKSNALLVSASAWALGISARIIQPGETPENILETLGKRLGLPAVRTATRQAMRLLGSHFVLGQSIEEALGRAATQREFRYSYDMLGEGARTEADAQRYFGSYARAIDAIALTAGNARLPERPGISVKLSALHPRYEAISRERVLQELTPRVLELARKAKQHDLNFTVDAEEADRLELSLEVIGAVLRDPSLAGWDGFGLAVQAYQKRAGAVIDWVRDAAIALDRRLMVRLVKGAYWDTEVKRAQERGLPDYPVFTRKAMTDLSYMACVTKLLAARPVLYPQFATHNALTVASVIEEAGGVEGLRIPAPARHGRGALRRPDRGRAGRGVPRLCAGRRASRPARLSGAAAAGERRELLVRVGRGRSVGAGRHDPAAPAGMDRGREPRAPSAHPAAARSVRRRSGRTRPAWSSATGLRLEALLAGVRSAAPLPQAKGETVADGAGGRRERICRLERDAGRGARGRAGAHRRSLRAEPRRACSRCCRRKAARRSTMRSPRCARRSTSAATTPPGPAHARAGSDAGADRRDQCAASSRARRVRLHQPVEFPAGDLHRSDRRRARRGQ